MAFNKFFKLTYDSFESSGEVKLFHTQKVLDSMGKDWVSRARATLTRKDKNATGALHKSLEYTVTVKNNVITMGLQGEPYGVFVQYGVQGAGPFVPPKNPHPYATKPYINRAPDSPFKFGSGSGGGSISVAIRKWVKDKQLEWRGLDGRFLSYDPYGIMVRRDDSAMRLLGNTVLADLMRSGEMQKIYDRWFNPGPTKINMPISSTLKTAFEIQALPY